MEGSDEDDLHLNYFEEDFHDDGLVLLNPGRAPADENDAFRKVKLTKQRRREGFDPWLIAAANGDRSSLLKLSRKRAINVNKRNNAGENALFVCVKYGAPDSTFRLLVDDLKVDPFAVNILGQTVLHYAAAENKTDLCSYLIRIGIAPAQTDSEGWLPLHSAASAGKIEAVRLLCGSGCDINAKNDQGDSPLHLAAVNGHLAVCEWLVKRGADLRIRNSRKLTASKSAVVDGDGATDTAIWLKQMEDEQKATHRFKKKVGEQMLSAVRDGDLRELQMLPPDSLFYTSGKGWTALHEAAYAGDLKVLRFLADQGLPYGKTTRKGQTALHIAASEDRLGAVQLLLEMGSDGFARTKSGDTVSMVAPAGGEVREWLSKELSRLAKIDSAIEGHQDVEPAWIEEYKKDKLEDTRTLVSPKRDQFIQWLEENDLGQYADSLKDDGFDTLKLLEGVEEADLDEMGMKKGHKRAFFRAVKELSLSESDNSGWWSSSTSALSTGRHSTRPTESNLSTLSVSSIGKGTYEISYDELSFTGIVGEGSFGIVRRAVWRGMDVAVKELKDAQLAASDLRHEAEMMRRVCHHDHVIQFVGVVLKPKPSVVTKFMENGSVEDALMLSSPRCIRRSLSDAKVVRMAADAACGVLHLHRERVVHRDLACRNLLLDENLRVRICDFGFSRIKRHNQSKGVTKSSTGPIRHMSPESLRFREYSEASDVFSFGVLLYEIATSRPPWENVNNLDVVVRVCEGERLPIPDDCDPVLAEIMAEAWQQDKTARPTMDSIFERLTSHWKVLAAVEESAPPRETPTSGDQHRYDSFSGCAVPI